MRHTRGTRFDACADGATSTQALSWSPGPCAAAETSIASGLSLSPGPCVAQLLMYGPKKLEFKLSYESLSPGPCVAGCNLDLSVSFNRPARPV